MAMDELSNGKNTDTGQTTAMPDRNPDSSSHDEEDVMRSPEISSPTPGTPNSANDLPEELLLAGWRKFWSKREKQVYYFNTRTQESMWELPRLPGQQPADPLSDPLGISSPGPSSHVPAPGPTRDRGDIRMSRQSIDIPSPGLTQKRRSSEEMGASQVKRPPLNFTPTWNFSVTTNVTMYERETMKFLPPHPEIEQLRAQYMDKLRKHYDELCKSRENISAPTNSFDRWMLERKAIDKGDDPVFPSVCQPAVSPSMFREIINDIPLKLQRPKYTVDARRQLSLYGDAAIKMLRMRNVSNDARKRVKWKVEETFAWLRQENTAYADIEELTKRLAHLKQYCQPHLKEAAKSSVESICIKIQTMATEYAAKLKEKHLKILKDNNIVPTERRPPPHQHRVMCYPLHHSIPMLRMRLPPVEHSNEKGITKLTFNGETLTLKTTYMIKLEQLYQIHSEDGQKFEYFLPRVWCLLRRYQGFFGPDEEGSQLQGALTMPVFECLHRIFGVTFECFASPFNCYFRQYCSAFGDTDCYFGSRGPLLEFHPLGGSFEANPPFCEELMISMVDHFEALLEEATDAMSFVIFIPEWRDPPTEALMRLESSRFRRNQMLLEPYQHAYKHGYQHKVHVEDNKQIKSNRGTCVFFLQNEAGFDKWGPTPDRVKELHIAARCRDIVEHSRRSSGSEDNR